jgi:hypothetical protein
MGEGLGEAGIVASSSPDLRGGSNPLVFDFRLDIDILLEVDMRREGDTRSVSSGLGGSTDDGGGFGAIRDNLNARCATESRKEAFPGDCAVTSTSTSGGGGKANVGAGPLAAGDVELLWDEGDLELA